MADETTESLNEFIATIYGVVADPALWPSVLDGFAERVDARGCIVFAWEERDEGRHLLGSMMSSAYEPEKLTAYLAAFGQYEKEDQDRFEALSLERDEIDLIECSMLFSQESDLLARPNVKAMMANDMRYRAAGLLNKDDRKRARFSIQRSENKGPFADAERRTMRLLLPHVAKAIELSRPTQELLHAHGALMEAMDRLRIGVCVLDRRGYLVVANREFDRQRDRYDIFKVDPSGRLQVHDRADPARFEELRNGIHGHGRFGARPRRDAIVTDRLDLASAICIEIAPMTENDALTGARFDGAILYSIDTTLGFDCDAGALGTVFGLTGTEVQTATLLGEGLTNRLIAERRDRSVETVNAQVKTLLAKTGCGTRTEFVRLLMGFGTTFSTVEPDE